MRNLNAPTRLLHWAHVLSGLAQGGDELSSNNETSDTYLPADSTLFTFWPPVMY